jgi:hypothetical protein
LSNADIYRFDPMSIRNTISGRSQLAWNDSIEVPMRRW